jgi:hypothetical protein
MTRHRGGKAPLSVGCGRADAAVAARQRVARALWHSSWRSPMTGTMTAVAHRLGGKIAFVHPLGAVLAGSPPVFVDAFCFALAAAHARAAGTQGCRSHHRRHDGDNGRGKSKQKNFGVKTRWLKREIMGDGTRFKAQKSWADGNQTRPQCASQTQRKKLRDAGRSWRPLHKSRPRTRLVGRWSCKKKKSRVLEENMKSDKTKDRVPESRAPGAGRTRVENEE